MKGKMKGVVGIVLTVILLASLTVGLAGAPAGAASSNLKFTTLELPKVEAWDSEATFADSEGDYWATPGIDVGPIAQTPDGGTLFAAAYYLDETGTFYEVMKSLDGGYSWTVTGFYDETSDVRDSTPIVDIVVSPEYSDDTTLAVATGAFVYISDDSGKNFTQLDNPWDAEVITDLDVTIAEDGDLALMVGTDAGDVYVAKGLLTWTAQDIPASISNAVLACAFLPTFAADGDIGLSAIVTTRGTTTMTFSFANVRDGGEWGDDIVNAPITNAEGDDFASEWARIAFPDDFDAFGIGNNVCFVGIVENGSLELTTFPTDPPDGSDVYKVICKEAGTSRAVDLDVRGVITTLLPTATAVTSIDICGDAEDATILVGTNTCNPGDTPSYWFTYKSEDSGDSWQFSFKQPTGDAMTRVLMAPDFGDSGLAYAATVGEGTSAFQRTTDGATSWNQISLIDYAPDGDYYVTSNGFSANGYNAKGTLYMTTSEQPITTSPLSTNGALWGRLDGKHWERILSYANAGVTAQLHRLDILGDGSAMFATDLNAGKIWRSTDMGTTFPKKISTKTPLTTVAPVSATTLYTGSVGEIWWSTRSGTGWTKPDDSEIPAGAAIINIGFPGDDIVLIGAVGGVFISSDGGETVENVGVNNPGDPLDVTIATADLGFAGNGIIYATMPANLVSGPLTGVGVWRTEVDLDNPGDAEWQQIDDNQDSTGDVVYDETLFAAGGPAIALPPSGVLYVIDGAAVDTDTDPDCYAGGLWRCTNPTADIDSVVPPYFERENKGLDTGDALGLLSLDLKPPALAPTFFCSNSTANYYDQVVMFTDILNVGVPLAIPEADSTGVGLLPEGYVYPEVTLAWQEMAGANSYQYQTAIDADFKTLIPPGCGFTTSLARGAIQLNPNMTYYWRVRVANEGSLIGAPLISPWSETWKFKTAIGASMARPKLEAPEAGAIDVALSPTFEWSGIEWAEVYEFELALDPTTTAGAYFAEPLVALVGTDALVSTAWKCDTALDYEGRYYWHVKAIGVDTDTPWSDVGTFTIMGTPPVVTDAPPPIVVEQPDVITPAWIWAIVIIGAILVIALVVLIVTTRRTP